MIIALFFSFAILLILGVPIIFTLGISSLLYISLAGIPLTILPQKMVNSLENFIFIALPLFILAGEIMNSGGITRRLVNVAKVFVGRFKGGLAYTNIVVSMLFGVIQGLATADTSAIGPILIPAMVKDGYKREFATAVTVASSTVGPIIPPSFLFIIFAMLAKISVAAMFLGGVIPGVLIGVSQMALVWFLGQTNVFKQQFPKGETIPFGRSIRYIVQGLPAIGMPIVIIGGILFGFVTATEAAAIAVAYALASSIAIGELKLSDVPRIFFRAAKLSGSCILLLSTATLFAWILTAERIPYFITTFLFSISENKYVVLLLMNIFLLFVGTFMDPTPALMVLTPILYPVLSELGLEPIHIGVFLCFNLIIGLTTPPVGQCLFIASSISGLSVEKISRAMIPFFLINIIVLMLITYIPIFVTLIPHIVLR